MSRFAILLNGPITLTQRLIKQVEGARALAADGGIVHAAALGLTVELWVGDFDSTSEELAARYSAIPQLRFPIAKDKTDGELATEEAIKRGATSLLLIGSFGGQADHAIGHLTLSLKLARAGIAAMLTSGTEEAYPILSGKTELNLPNASRLSLIALSDLSDLTLRGTHWRLTEARVDLGSTSTISNWVDGPVSISLASGYGIVIAYPKDI